MNYPIDFKMEDIIDTQYYKKKQTKITIKVNKYIKISECEENDEY